MKEIDELFALLTAKINAFMAATEETVAGQEAVELLDEVKSALKEHADLTA